LEEAVDLSSDRLLMNEFRYKGILNTMLERMNIVKKR
jgi:hypothetical protein